MSRRIDICPTCKGKGEIIVDNWITEGMTEEELEKEKEKALADIVEVVRCKDCANKGAAFCMIGDIPITKENENCYCSYGERREE